MKNKILYPLVTISIFSYTLACTPKFAKCPLPTSKKGKMNQRLPKPKKSVNLKKINLKCI